MGKRGIGGAASLEVLDARALGQRVVDLVEAFEQAVPREGIDGEGPVSYTHLTLPTKA